MNNYNESFIDTEDYAFSFSEEVNLSTDEKIQAIFSKEQPREIKAFAANILIGNIPAKKLNDNVGDTFELRGFFVKQVKFKDNHNGRYVTLFGYSETTLCAYVTTSDKVYDSLSKIVVVYGKPDIWKNGVKVRIRMNEIENGKAYCLEVLE